MKSAYDQGNTLGVTLPAEQIRPSWWDHAACLGVGAEIFFPPGEKGAYFKAQQICASCPIEAKGPCRALALSGDIKDGFWAGMKPEDRERFHGRRPKSDYYIRKTKKSQDPGS